MELYRIGEEKLKVLLTPFDMMKYNLTLEKLDYENTETRKAIWNILDHAKHETGFDGASGRICIEVFPEKNGGCAIYITKVRANEETGKGGIELAGEGKEATALFSFENAEALLSACHALSHVGYTPPADAFFEKEKKGGARYYLTLQERRPQCGGKKMKNLRPHLFLEEFGKRVEGEMCLSYLHEHTLPICEKNAVETLAPLANFPKNERKT